MKSNKQRMMAALAAATALLMFSSGFASDQNPGNRQDAKLVTYDSLAAPSAPPLRLDVHAVLGGSNLRSDSPNFRGGDITAIMGGANVDLSQADMTRSDATIHVTSLWGGIVLKVPPGWAVVNNATLMLGGMHDGTAKQTSPSKRLTITGYVIMGGMDIKN